MIRAPPSRAAILTIASMCVPPKIIFSQQYRNVKFLTRISISCSRSCTAAATVADAEGTVAADDAADATEGTAGASAAAAAVDGAATVASGTVASGTEGASGAEGASGTEGASSDTAAKGTAAEGNTVNTRPQTRTASRNQLCRNTVSTGGLHKRRQQHVIVSKDNIADV